MQELCMNKTGFYDMKGERSVNIKRIFIVLIVIMFIFTLVACAGQGTGGGAATGDSGSSGAGSVPVSSLSGTAIEVLTKLDDDLKQKGIEMPMTLPPTEVSSDMSQNDIGLSSGDFSRLVSSAASSLAAIGTFAHQIAVIQANDAAAATEIKNLISGSGGYDAQKWICVWPDKVIVVESGAYVLLAAANTDVVDAAVEAFRTEAGTIGTVITFFEHDGGFEAPAGGEPITPG